MANRWIVWFRTIFGLISGPNWCCKSFDQLRLFSRNNCGRESNVGNVIGSHPSYVYDERNLNTWVMQVGPRVITISLALAFFLTTFPASAQDSTPVWVTNVRAGNHSFGTRVVLDVSAPTNHKLSVFDQGLSIAILLPEIVWDTKIFKFLRQGKLIESFKYTPTGARGGILILRGTVPVTVLEEFTVPISGGRGHRLVFDLAKADYALPATDPPGRVEPVVKIINRPLVQTEPLPGGLSSPPVARKGSTDEAGRFILTAVQVKGATVFAQEDFRPYYASLIGSKVDLDGLKKAANAMTAHYRNAGFVLSTVIVPQQEVEDGRVWFQAVEGYINEVIVEGSAKSRSDLFDHWAAEIKKQRPITSAVMEHYTLLAKELAGVTVKSVLRPAEDVPGASDLVLKVVRKKTFDAEVTLDNRASKTTGPAEIKVNLAANNLFGLYEKTSLSYNVTPGRKSEYVSVGLEGMVLGQGTSLSLSGAYSRSAPGGVLKDLEMRSKTRTFAGTVNQPLIRSRDVNLDISGGLTFTNSYSEALGTRLNEDTLRVFNVGSKYRVNDDLNGENELNFGLSRGLNFFGASDQDPSLRSRADGESEFTKLTLGYSRLQSMPHDLKLSANFAGQWAFTPLLSSEEFAFGGPSFGRAYDSSEITGDHGTALALELQYKAQPKIPLIKSLQPYAFWDFGATWDIDAKDDTAQRSASSTGLGMRIGITDYVNSSFELTLPLTRTVSSADKGDGNDPRFFFNLSAKY